MTAARKVRGTHAASVLAGGVSRHGRHCGCRYCAAPVASCGPNAHAALIRDAAAFAALPLVGYQEVEALDDEPADLLELRDCRCGQTLSVPIGAPIVERLLRARREDDVAMIGRCRAALRGDAEAVRSLRAAVEMDRLMAGGAR